MLLKTITVSCLMAALLLGSGDCSPSGAPVAACADMAPQHNNSVPQSNPSPYTATVTAAGADLFNFRLTANDAARPFKGLFVQARDANNQIVGTFAPNTDVKVIECTTGVLNAATHTSNNTKTDVSVVWASQPGLVAPVNMYYTTCENFATFWVMESVPIPLP